MAELVSLEGEVYKKRDPLGVWGLSIITLGIYYFVWYYKINDEARRNLRDPSIKPGVSLMAVLFGWVLIVPPFVSTYRTGERAQRMQQRAGVISQISPALVLLASFFFALQVPYLQEGLNKVWQVVGDEPVGRDEMPPPPTPS